MNHSVNDANSLTSAFDWHRLLQAVQLYDRLSEKSFKKFYYQEEIFFAIRWKAPERHSFSTRLAIKRNPKRS